METNDPQAIYSKDNNGVIHMRDMENLQPSKYCALCGKEKCHCADDMNATQNTTSIEEIEKAYPEAYRLARKFHDLIIKSIIHFNHTATMKTTKSINWKL